MSKEGQNPDSLEAKLDKRMRESFRKHFDEADRKHNKQIARLKDLLRDVEQRQITRSG